LPRIPQWVIELQPAFVLCTERPAMKTRLVCSLAALLTLSFVSTGTAAEKSETKAPAALNFKMKTIDGKQVALARKYKGKVLLVVNVASRCGYTPQYEQLQALHKKYAKEGLAVVAFPCNQFGRQEPGTDKEIKKFCTANYGVQFDVFSKIEVNGKNAAPLYKHLTKLKIKPKGPGKVSWNFEKFVIGRNGKVVARFPSKARPDSSAVLAVIEKELAKK
jgi:glutathione peroxidase